MFEIIFDEYCFLFMNKFYLDYFIMFLLFYFLEKLYIFENIFYVYNCKLKYVLYIDICILNINICTSVFDVVDFK